MSNDGLPGKQWIPSNSSVGMAFVKANCDICAHWKVLREGADSPEICDIVSRSFRDEAIEWRVLDNSDVVCVAWSAADPVRCTQTDDMFLVTNERAALQKMDGVDMKSNEYKTALEGLVTAETDEDGGLYFSLMYSPGINTDETDIFCDVVDKWRSSAESEDSGHILEIVFNLESLLKNSFEELGQIKAGMLETVKKIDEAIERHEKASPSQRLITEECTAILEMLLAKNRKYGDSALNPSRIFSRADAIEQINVRIDDKLSRIASAQDDDDEDAVMDLIGYLVLLRIARRLHADDSGAAHP